jgi:hypothetical protein
MKIFYIRALIRYCVYRVFEHSSSPNNWSKGVSDYERGRQPSKKALKIIFENDIASDGIESATAAVGISRHGAVANSAGCAQGR